MAFWRWLRDAFRAPPDTDDAPPVEDTAPASSMSAEEAYLRHLLLRPSPAPEGAQGEVGDREFWAALGRLIASGKERTAIELLGRFAAARPEDADLAMRLAELLCERHSFTAARPLLEKLIASPAHALRAHDLWADLAVLEGDEAEARRHLESILAVDLDHPRARARLERLAPIAWVPIQSPAAATLAGVPGGSSLAGRYRLVREIGRGASGAVYVAHDDELDREMALKILHPHTRGESRARAWNEARVAAAIRHPGVVAIYDLDEEHAFIAMELCEGGALRERIATGPLPPRDALSRANEICATLAAVHRRGIVHGDVKPANLLFRRAGGDLVLGDFGLARLTSAEGPSEGGRGTLAYMAPEQRKGERYPAGDLYAAGVILLELLLGTPALQPWLGDRARLIRGEARWDGTLPDLGAVTPRLRALVEQLLSADPGTRPTAEVAARALNEFRDSVRA